MLLEIQVYGESQINRELLRFGARAVDARPAWELIADDMGDITKAQFETEGGARSGGWVPLKPETLAAKQNKGLDSRILHATLALSKSFESGDPGHIQVMTPQTMEWGSKVPYGVYHQSTAPRRVLPRRPIIDFTELDRQSFVKTLQRWVVEGELA